MSEDDSVSPLFNKMDALMARHRGGTRAGDDDDIPVLTEELDDIPVLTEALEDEDIPILIEPVDDDLPVGEIARAPHERDVQVANAHHEELLFDPREFHRPPPTAQLTMPAPTPAPREDKPAAAEAFLDLPLLDLDALATEVQPFGASDVVMASGAAPAALRWEEEDEGFQLPAPGSAQRSEQPQPAPAATLRFDDVAPPPRRLDLELEPAEPAQAVEAVEAVDGVHVQVPPHVEPGVVGPVRAPESHRCAV
ncbi:MAG TPA: hypothetical protein VLC08_00240 [Chitinolyticbacter sp.]|nr:hypothetical protein [Chitinolyticbacter sp.]